MTVLPFTPRDGSREVRYQRLLALPHRCDDAEFEHLLEEFRERLTPAQTYDLCIERLQRRECADRLEQRAVLAAAIGDLAEAERLRKVLKRRNALQLRVIDP